MTGLLKLGSKTKSHCLFIVTVTDFQGICFYYETFQWLSSLLFVIDQLCWEIRGLNLQPPGEQEFHILFALTSN